MLCNISLYKGYIIISMNRSTLNCKLYFFHLTIYVPTLQIVNYAKMHLPQTNTASTLGIVTLSILSNSALSQPSQKMSYAKYIISLTYTDKL